MSVIAKLLLLIKLLIVLHLLRALGLRLDLTLIISQGFLMLTLSGPKSFRLRLPSVLKTSSTLESIHYLIRKLLLEHPTPQAFRLWEISINHIGSWQLTLRSLYLIPA